MKAEFEINLVVGKDFLRSYMWYTIPSVGDTLALDENKFFSVERRLLLITDSNRVVLFGTLE